MRRFDALGVLGGAVASLVFPVAAQALQCGDLDGNGSVVAGDALRLLRFAVGQSVEIGCPPGLHCWDADADSVCDLSEDVSGDGSCDAADCKGEPGAAGPKGDPGATGPAGAAGPQGPSGVVRVLGFDGQWGPAQLPGNGGGTLFNSTQCRTNSHVAGTGEVAVANFHGAASPQFASEDILYIDVMVSQNGAALASSLTGMAAEGFGDGVGQASVSKHIPLTAGVSYVFGAGFGSNGVMNVAAGAYCQGTVLIVKTSN